MYFVVQIWVNGLVVGKICTNLGKIVLFAENRGYVVVFCTNLSLENFGQIGTILGKIVQSWVKLYTFGKIGTILCNAWETTPREF